MMNEVTPEAVAKHAEAWPAKDGSGLWRRQRIGNTPVFVVLSADGMGRVWLFTELLGWQLVEDLDEWDVTPVRPDGSDLPADEPLIDSVKALADVYSAVLAALTAGEWSAKP